MKSTAPPGPGFEPDASTRIGVADSGRRDQRLAVYGHVPMDHRAGDYDHMMFQDDTVQRARPTTTASAPWILPGSAGRFRWRPRCAPKRRSPPRTRSPPSRSMPPNTRPRMPLTATPIHSQRGFPSPTAAARKTRPLDVWWAIEFPAGKRVRLRGVKIMGDDRPIIPLQKQSQGTGPRRGRLANGGRA